MPYRYNMTLGQTEALIDGAWVKMDPQPKIIKRKDNVIEIPLKDLDASS